MSPVAFLAFAVSHASAGGDVKHASYADQSVPERYRGRTILNKPKGFKEKVVALTFDDGPDPTNTPKVVGYLAKYNAKATFFMIGSYASRNKKLVKFVAERGHVVGSHSWDHPAAPPKGKAGPEIWLTAKAIYASTGVWPSLFRPPYGIQDGRMAKIARTERYGVVIWNCSSADTAHEVTSDDIVSNVAQAKAGAIVLMHDGPGKVLTVKALPTILSKLNAKGYKFITVPEMLRKWDAYLTSKGK